MKTFDPESGTLHIDADAVPLLEEKYLQWAENVKKIGRDREKDENTGPEGIRSTYTHMQVGWEHVGTARQKMPESIKTMRLLRIGSIEKVLECKK